MSNKAKETVTEEVKEEKVEVFIPRGQADEDPNFFVSVNGKNYILPKGKKSMVPKFVADEIHRSWEAEEAMYKRRSEMEIKE